MGQRATAGTCLVVLVRQAVPLLREAERQCPRTGPGAKPRIPDWFMGVLIMIAVGKRKKSKSAQFRFLVEKQIRRQIAAATGQRQFPARLRQPAKRPHLLAADAEPHHPQRNQVRLKRQQDPHQRNRAICEWHRSFRDFDKYLGKYGAAWFR